MDHKSGLMAQDTTGNGGMTKLTEKANLNMLMGMSTAVIGSMIKLKAKAHTAMQMGLFTMEAGLMINSTVWVLKAGLMVQDMKEIILKERKKETVN